MLEYVLCAANARLIQANREWYLGHAVLHTPRLNLLLTTPFAVHT